MSKSLIEVILLHDFQKRGKFGDKIKVARGHAKNWLIPNKFAIYANEKNLKKFDEIKASALKESEELRNIALELAKKVESVRISIMRQSAQDNKIFGTISSKDISEEFRKFDIDIARSKIVINESIKYLGVYNIKVVLHPDIIIDKEIFIVNNHGSVKNITKHEEEIMLSEGSDKSFDGEYFDENSGNE